MGGASGIPLSEFEVYCRMNDIIDSDELEELFALISTMDGIYITTVGKKQEHDKRTMRSGKK